MSQPNRLRAWFIELRAVLILAHIVVIGLQAFPAPVGGASKGTRETPSVRGMIADASAITGLPEAQVDALVFGGVETWIAARKKVLKPFSPYYKWAGTKQSWRMMAIINRRSARLRVEIDGALAYRTADSEARWRAEIIESARMRGAVIKYAWKLNRGDYKRLSAWIIDEAVADYGEDVDVRICVERAAIPGPEDPPPRVRCGWEITR